MVEEFGAKFLETLLLFCGDFFASLGTAASYSFNFWFTVAFVVAPAIAAANDVHHWDDDWATLGV